MRLHVRGVVLPGGEQRELWAVDGRLTYEPVKDAQTVADGGWIVPGLVDCHCHIGMKPEGDADEDEMVAQAVLDRDAGALLIRDAGSPVDNRFVQDRHDLPRLIRAGRHVARPKRYMRDVAVEVEPDGLVEVVERQAGLSDGWVKLVGDWIDRGVGDLAPLWPDDALAAAVARAHELGARVAVHTFGEEALPGLIAAGVDTIEHGTGLTADLLDEAVRQGIHVTPTLLNIETFPDIADRAEKYPAYGQHMRALHRTAHERIRAAYEAGLPLLAGTDAGGVLPHGLVAKEIQQLHKAGIPAEAALAAGSWAAREYLGLPGLEEGAPADFVVYPADPRLEPTVLDFPAHIVLRGNVVD